MASVAFPELSKRMTVKDGTKYGYIKIEAKGTKPTLLWLHGYPSSSYHWHFQVKQCQDAGYGAIIPDLLGYGDTDSPENFEAYDNTVMARQIVDILDDEGLSKVVGVGHDWGSNFLSVLARHYPERFSLLIWMSVGYSPSQDALTDIDSVNKIAIQAIGRPIFGYWYFHNQSDAASVIENADPESMSTLLFPEDPDIWKANICETGGMISWIKEKKKTKLAPWMAREHLEMHGRIMKMGGFTGPLNWYKQAMAGVTAKSEANMTKSQTKIKTPTLFIGTKRDVICVPAFQEANMEPFVEDLTIEQVDTGHWCMLEKPDETWACVENFIKARI